MTSQYEPLVEPGRLMLNIPVSMRDGVNLSASFLGWTREFIKCGYVVVVQDYRGRDDSEHPSLLTLPVILR